MLVGFDITPVRSASVILTDSNKQPLPLGSQVHQLSNKEVPSTIIGFDGEVYLDTLDEHNTLEVTTPSGDVCTVSFDYSKQGDETPLIGPLICQKVQP
ncbi:FimD/PapC C-terminal domain-containing protein [Psychrobacter sp. JCM 18900]|uniref:FimD/PapC C-terminal domain-containing protein n=1 Tax=Psychrobacter sp. JCM 18900 TaxID=1298608 RepID=UPI0021C392A7|nr:FimD/PapC C-terminal domain-containing protein [Psychrobacter sp. JCM 18900]